MSDPQASPAPMTPEEVAASNVPPDPDPGLNLDVEPPPPVDNAHVAPGAEPFAAHPALGTLDRIEELAIRFGGDVMAEIRHLVAQVRTML